MSGRVGWRRVVHGLGKASLTVGVVALLFVVYEIWGTGLAEAKAQRQLKKQFAARSSRLSAATAGRTSGPTSTVVPLPPPTGSAVAILDIPRLKLSDAVVEGVGLVDLEKGPGHYPNTPLPGEPGNTAIAGHRTTYGHPFYNLDELQVGDDILLSTHSGTYRYSVVSQEEVLPTDVAVVAPTADNRLTLTTCTPRYSASHRLVVVARLVSPAIAPPTAAAALRRARAPFLPDFAVLAAEDGLSGKNGPLSPAIGWGTVLTVIWSGAYVIGRRWRRWASYLIASPLLLVTLFLLFESVARLMPTSV